MKMRYKSLLLLLIVNFWNVYCAFAQADISMATHWYNRSNYNPASIARTEYIYYFSNIRQQWLGLEGAPSVLNIQASEYIHHLKSAFGISLVGEKIGVSTAYNPMLTYAYRISGERDWSLSMGLSGGVFVRTLNGALFEAENITDPAISYETGKRISPDANLGFEFQSNHFILSLSSTHLFSINQSNQLYLNSNHRYGSVIYKNDNSELMNYHLGMQVVNRGNLTILEGNVSVRFKRPTGLVKGPREIFELGFTYRTSHQITGLFGMNLSPNVRIGYAIDWSYSMGYNQNGTHELMLEFRIPSSISSTRPQCPNLDYWYH